MHEHVFSKIKKNFQRQVRTSVLSESSFPSNSSSSSLPEPLGGPGLLGVSPGPSMLMVVASGFAAREVATSPNSEIN